MSWRKSSGLIEWRGSPNLEATYPMYQEPGECTGHCAFCVAPQCLDRGLLYDAYDLGTPS